MNLIDGSAVFVTTFCAALLALINVPTFEGPYIQVAALIALLTVLFNLIVNAMAVRFKKSRTGARRTDESKE